MNGTIINFDTKHVTVCINRWEQNFTHLTTLMDRVVGGVGVWSHASDLWTIFAIHVALHSTYDDFQEKKNLHG